MPLHRLSSLLDLTSQAPSANVTVFMEGSTKARRLYLNRILAQATAGTFVVLMLLGVLAE